LDDFFLLGFFIMLLFKMYLLEELKLLKDSEQIIFAKTAYVQIGKGPSLERELLFQRVALVTSAYLDFAFFNGL
jgi:hypothetical protein